MSDTLQWLLRDGDAVSWVVGTTMKAKSIEAHDALAKLRLPSSNRQSRLATPAHWAWPTWKLQPRRRLTFFG